MDCHARGELVPCRFCGGFDGDGHLFWECSHLLLVQIRENPEFHDLTQRDTRTWPRCLLWHGWLPASDSTGRWAVGVGETAANILESPLGGYFPHNLEDSAALEEFVSGTGSAVLAAELDVWTDGSLVRDEVTNGVLVSLRLLLGLVGFIDLGGIWICSRLVITLEVSGVDFTFRFPDLCRQFRGLNFGGSL